MEKIQNINNLNKCSSNIISSMLNYMQNSEINVELYRSTLIEFVPVLYFKKTYSSIFPNNNENNSFINLINVNSNNIFNSFT
jgi:hypothetical protein